MGRSGQLGTMTASAGVTSVIGTTASAAPKQSVVDPLGGTR